MTGAISSTSATGRRGEAGGRMPYPKRSTSYGQLPLRRNAVRSERRDWGSSIGCDSIDADSPSAVAVSSTR